MHQTRRALTVHGNATHRSDEHSPFSWLRVLFLSFWRPVTSEPTRDSALSCLGRQMLRSIIFNYTSSIMSRAFSYLTSFHSHSLINLWNCIQSWRILNDTNDQNICKIKVTILRLNVYLGSSQFMHATITYFHPCWAESVHRTIQTLVHGQHKNSNTLAKYVDSEFFIWISFFQNESLSRHNTSFILFSFYLIIIFPKIKTGLLVKQISKMSYKQ